MADAATQPDPMEAAAVTAVEHRPRGGTGPYAGNCAVCHWPYPCPTIQPAPAWLTLPPALPPVVLGACCWDQPFTARHTRTDPDL